MTETMTSNRFDQAVGYAIASDSIQAFQVNIGLTCNLACRHCHVSSNPQRKEQMTQDTMAHIYAAIKSSGAKAVDITGGAPEMNPHFREFVISLRDMGVNVQVRTNLTIMDVEGYGDLPEFFAENSVALVASLPCYLEENVDKQRGEGVYWDSIKIIKRLNALGYGKEAHLPLGLVYNPGGPSLPPAQKGLEAAYREELLERFDIEFTFLATITNMAIGQFRADLKRDGKYDEYTQLLESSFNGTTVEHVMCRHQLSIGWDGTLYDCDFNLALKMPVGQGLPDGDKLPRNISDFSTDVLKNRQIVTANHCFGCTAGCGSSCAGSLIE